MKFYDLIKEELAKYVEDNIAQMTEHAYYDNATDNDLALIDAFMQDLKKNIVFNSDNTIKALQTFTLPAYMKAIDHSQDFIDLWRLFDYCPIAIYRTNNTDLFVGDVYVVAYQICDVLNDIRYYIVDAK